jgi:hypothetical protein
MRQLFLALTLCLSVVPATAAETFSFDLLPADGNVTGPAAATVGWGYSIQNQSASFWLAPTALNAGVFTQSTPELLFDFPEIAPGTTVTVPFNPATGTGLFQVTWDSSVPLGFVESGAFVLSAGWWNGDPLAGGSFVAAAPDATQNYSATVAAPEPTSIGLVGFALICGAVASRFRPRQCMMAGHIPGSSARNGAHPPGC